MKKYIIVTKGDCYDSWTAKADTLEEIRELKNKRMEQFKKELKRDLDELSYFYNEEYDKIEITNNKDYWMEYPDALKREIEISIENDKENIKRLKENTYVYKMINETRVLQPEEQLECITKYINDFSYTNNDFIGMTEKQTKEIITYIKMVINNLK